jgi:hypothetical protein
VAQERERGKRKIYKFKTRMTQTSRLNHTNRRIAVNSQREAINQRPWVILD